METDQTVTIDISAITTLIDIIDMFYNDSISTLTDSEQRTQLVQAVTDIANAAKSTDPSLSDDLLTTANTYASWLTDTDEENNPITFSSR